MSIDELIDEAKGIVNFVTEPTATNSFQLLARLKGEDSGDHTGFYDAFEARITDKLAKGLISAQEAAMARKALEDARKGVKDELFAAVSAYAAQGNISGAEIKAHLETVQHARMRAKAGRRTQLISLTREDVDRFYTFAKTGFERSAEILAQNKERGFQGTVNDDDVTYIARQALAEALGISYDAASGFALQISVKPVSGSFEAGKRR